MNKKIFSYFQKTRTKFLTIVLFFIELSYICICFLKIYLLAKPLIIDKNGFQNRGLFS
ncbi:MAG: hypothetical protein H6Q19_7 [Bacteroidetes bacterium]|nr:hypothetical protein [Bacteroidota bacterium]